MRLDASAFAQGTKIESRRRTVTGKKYETIKVEKADGITWVILNRPDKRNAMSPQLHLDMDDALDDLVVDEETEVLVLTGAG
jgi:feruloyl-CoA hydratase/lyase